MSQPVKIGIVGLGRAGWGMHCRELDSHQSQFQITAVCDPIASRRQSAAEKYGCHTYENIEQLIIDPDVELVDIASRSSDHFSHGMLALTAGKKVLMEKPFCLNHQEAKTLAETAKTHGTELYIRHNRRFDPDFLHVREMIDSGILGEVYSIKLYRHSYQRRDDWQTLKIYGGGQLLNWGPHIIDHGLQLLQSPLKSIWSDLKQIAAAGDSEDHVKIILTGEGGRTIDIEISGGSVLPSPTYQIYGSQGGLSLSGNELLLKYLDPERLPSEKKANPGTPGEEFGSSGTFQTTEELHWIEKSLQVAPHQNYNLWDELYNAIRCGHRFPIRIEEALEVMKVISEVKKDTVFE